MKYLTLLFSIILFCFVNTIHAQSNNTLAERLGYSKTDKLLIIHADDIGVSHSENRATFDAFAKGMVNSGSIMVPCPWFPELAAYAREHPEADLGIHLTLTAEWKNYKWPTVSPTEEMPALINDQGFLYDNCGDATANATPEMVEKELRAQIDRAIEFGVKPTHLDSHMGCLFNPEFLPSYIKMGLEYNIPVMLPRESIFQFPGMEQLVPKKMPLVDRVLMALPDDIKNGMAPYYTKVLNELKPGVNVLLIHLAYDDAEMQAVTLDHPDFGAAWRQGDYDFFTSDKCRELLKQNSIKLITWREIGKLME